MDRFERLPPSGVAPRPAATVVLLREGAPGLQLLLMRRNRSAGFVPGAYVFPGGRVDAQDAHPALVSRIERLTAKAAAARLDLPGGNPPAIAYYLAAAREAFEEAAVLVARPGGRFLPETASGHEHLIRLREHLMAGTLPFTEVLDELEVGIDGAALEYIAHWITPEAESRRYDTRFFAALAPAGSRSATHATNTRSPRSRQPPTCSQNALIFCHPIVTDASRARHRRSADQPSVRRLPNFGLPVGSCGVVRLC